MPNVLSVATFLLLFLTLGSTQQTTSPKGGCDTQADPCDSASTQSDMNLCYGEQYSKADARLNTVYQDLLKQFANGSGQYEEQNEPIQKLKAAEHAWLTYRDLHCSAAKDLYKGGSMAPMVWSMCMETVTQHRIEELNAAYENQ
jgi:uncharacterized protein YecT (DUF1311 family)